MKFAFIYHSGNVPDYQYAANCEQLWKWIDALKQRGIETAGLASNNCGKTASTGLVKDYEGDIFAVSIIEAESIDAYFFGDA